METIAVKLVNLEEQIKKKVRAAQMLEKQIATNAAGA